MAKEYKLPYTAFEISDKLRMVDETKSSLKNDYYTSTEIDTKLDEVNTSFKEINSFAEETIASIDGIKAFLETKADLVDGKIPVEQLPDDIGSGGGSGVTSWNDLEDKPFGESGTKITWDNQPTDTIVSTGTKIDWDGAPTSTYEMINKDGMEIYFYKVSESVDTIIDGTVALTTPEEDSDMPLSSEVVQTTDSGENGIYIVNVKVANSTFNFDNAFGGDLTFKESGLYFVSITMNGQVSRVTSFADQFYGLVLYKIHEPLDTLYGCRMSLIDGEETAELIFKEGDSDLNQPPSVLDSGSSIAMPYLFNIINDNETVVLEGIEILFAQAGLYVIDFALIDMDGVIFNYLASPDYKVVKIDKKFMPDDVGGIVSWNDLKDKPFYETGWSIEWDGTPTNEFFDVTDTMGAILYKVSNEPKTKDELIGATCKYILLDDNEEVQHTISSSDIQDTDSENGFIIFDNPLGLFASALEDGTYNFMGISFILTKGIWFVKASGSYYPIYLDKGEIKKIDKKFLPDDIGGGNVDLSDYYTKSETDASLTVKADLVNGKVPLEQLPDDIGGGSIADCPTYTGGTMVSVDPIMIYNQPKLISSMTADYSFDVNNGVYDIDANEFIFTFESANDITSDSPIVINIATGCNGTTINDYTSDLNVELQTTELKKNSWYTAYCLYSESQGKMVGYLISASADVDTSALQTKANLVTSINENSTNEQYPSAKLLYDLIGDCDAVLDEISALIGE